MNSTSNMKVLFISLEFPHWSMARAWGYSAHRGIEEGFKNNNIEFTTITTQYISCAKQICAGKHFDQIWVEIVHHDFDVNFWEWLTDLSPVRIGMAFESLQYTAEEIKENPGLLDRCFKVEARFKYLTHIVVVDEVDVKDINRSNRLNAFWWPSTVPNRFIIDKVTFESKKVALFSGSAYGMRASFLKHHSLQGILIHQSSTDSLTLNHDIFNILQRVACISINRKMLGVNLFAPTYNRILQYVRQKDFADYLKGLLNYSAVVNLPSYVKAFPGRVVEGMAAGRPVISNEIPDRPRNNNLFINEKEILFYKTSDPEQLAEQIMRVLADSKFANTIAANARRKLKLFHTTEKRVKQVLHWVETGEQPNYD